MKHIFPFSRIEKGSRIVIYGASERGYDFYRQLVSTEYCRIVLWVDRQDVWYRNYLGLPVETIDKIKEIDYDLVVLTAEKQSVADSMMQALIECGVEKRKIFWEEDCLIKGNIAKGYDEERIRKETQEAVQGNAGDYIAERRLDIAIRVMYARDVLKNGKAEIGHEDMYRKLMMSQNDCKEPTENMISAFFSEYAVKRGWKAFESGFQDLIMSMRENGFKREGFLPLDRKNRIINGAHRLATAIALDIPIWVRQYPFDGVNMDLGEDWLYHHGFSQEEIKEIKAVNREIKGCVKN